MASQVRPHAIAACTALSTIIFVVIILFVRAPIDSPLSQYDASEMLTILTILLSGLSFLVAWSLSECYKLLGWKRLVKKLEGDLAGLTRRTSMSTIIEDKAKRMVALCAIAQGIFMLLNWVASILLFLQTDIATVYRPLYEYQATAGVGQFNGTMVALYIKSLQDAQPGYNLKVMPYSTQSLVYNLVSNPVHAISVPSITCAQDSQCQSYLMNGGLYLTAPWPPTNFSSAPLVQIHNATGRQIEFQPGLAKGQKFGAQDCTLYTDNNTSVAMQFCAAEAQGSEDSFVAGLYLCTEGVQNETCKSVETVPHITSTISSYQRTSDLIVSRTNSSIISVSDLGRPILDPVPDMVGFRQAIDWLLDWKSAGVPVTSSIAAMFWNAQVQLSNEFWDSEPSIAFQSIIAYPFWMFHDNNIANVNLPVHDIHPNLPEEYFVKVSVAVPLSKILISDDEFITFAVFEGLILMYLWCAVVWLYYSSSPMTSKPYASIKLQNIPGP